MEWSPETQTKTVKTESPTPLADSCNLADSKLCVKMRAEDKERDALKRSEGLHTIYLECSDDGVCEDRPWRFRAAVVPKTNKLEQITGNIEQVLAHGSLKTSLNQSLSSYASLLHELDADTQTYNAPMTIGQNQSYWATTSRPYERKLVDKLVHSQGEITHAALMKTALDVSKNDSQLAILVLANFTKNMAAVERRQTQPSQIDSSLRTTYNKDNIDSLFHRIEGLSDHSSEKYNKEGAIYHFYGAMLVGSQWGPVTNLMVAYDNFSLEGLGEEDGGTTDRVKEAAGLAGADCGSALWHKI